MSASAENRLQARDFVRVEKSKSQDPVLLGWVATVYGAATADLCSTLSKVPTFSDFSLCVSVKKYLTRCALQETPT